MSELIQRVLVSLAVPLFNAAKASKDASHFARKIRGPLKLEVMKATRDALLKEFGK